MEKEINNAGQLSAILEYLPQDTEINVDFETYYGSHEKAKLGSVELSCQGNKLVMLLRLKEVKEETANIAA